MVVVGGINLNLIINKVGSESMRLTLKEKKKAKEGK